MKLLIKVILFVSAILVSISELSYPHSASAQLGMPAPRCDEVLNPDIYFEKYINSTEFKATHPTYSGWKRLPDNYDSQTVCINKDEKALLMWDFILPSSLSKYQFSYKYKVALVVNWDKSAYIAHEITPEDLILKAESLPEIKEFITKFSSELSQSAKWDNYWIGSSSFGESSGYASPPEIKYTTDKLGSITLSDKGVEWADLSIHRNWESFPTVKIGLSLAEEALTSNNCVLDMTPTAVSRYSPHSRKNEQEPEEFIYNSYKISCTGSDYRYATVNIYPNDGRFTVWLENRKQISSGKISDSDLEKIQAISSKPSLSSDQTPVPILTVIPSSDKKTGTLDLKIILIGTAAFSLLSTLAYFLIRRLKRTKNNILEPEKNEVPVNTDNSQTNVVPPLEQTEKKPDNPEHKI